MGKLGVLAVGLILIIGVLIIGYKMDNATPKAPAKRAAKQPKKKAKVKEEYVEEIQEDEDYEDPYKTDNFSDMPYEDENEGNFGVENDYEDVTYEDEDVSLFETSNDVESSFDSDIDNELSFEQADTVQDDYEDISDVNDFGTAIEEPEVAIPEPVVEDVEEVVPEVEEVVEEKPKRRGRPKKEKTAPEPVEDVADPYDFSSTMVFDTDKLASDLEEIDNMDKEPISTGSAVDSRLDIFGGFGASAESKSEPEPVKEEVQEDPYDFSSAVKELGLDDYSEPVYDIDEKIDALDEEEPKVEKNEEIVDGPFKPAENEAESFMNELKRMQESAEAEDFAGFAVETRSEELKETHKKYTKKKVDPVIEETQISFIPEEKSEPESESTGMDMNFLEEMEKNLKENQKERLNKKTSKKGKDE